MRTTVIDTGTATCSFSVDTPGIYKITTRVFAKDSGADSFYFQIDNSLEDIYDLNPTASPSEYNVWREDDLIKRGINSDPYIITLTLGTYALTFRGRELDTRLDYFYLTRITDTTPPSAPTGLIVN